MNLTDEVKKVVENKVASAGIGYTFGNLLIKGIAFLSTPIFSRMMTTEQYGIIGSYIAYETYLIIVVGLLFNSSVKNAKYELQDLFNRYISNVILVIWGNTLLLGAIVLIFKNTITAYIGFSQTIILLMLLHATGDSIIYIFNAYVSLSYAYKRYLYISFINAIGNLVLSILFMKTVCSGQKEIGRILGYCFPVIGIGLYITFYFFKISLPKLNRKLLSFAYRYSIPLIPYGLADATLGQFSRLVIKNISGNSVLGIYSLSYSVYSIIGIVRTSLDNVWGPWFFEKYSSNDYALIKKRSGQYVWGLAFFTIVVLFLSPEVIAIMGSKDYHDAIYSVLPLVAASYFVFLISIPIQTEYYHKKTQVISIGMVIVAVLNIGLTFVVVKYINYVGAAFCTLFSYLLLSVYHFVIAYRLTKKEIFDLRAICIASGLILACVTVNYFIINVWVLRYILVLLTFLCAFEYMKKKFC